MAFSSAGYHLAIGFDNGSVLIFEPQSGERLSSLQLTQDAIGALAYSPIRQQLAISGGGNSIYLWDGQSQEASIKLDGHNANIQSIAYSLCGQWVVSGSKDRTVRLWRQWQKGESESWQSAGVVPAFFGIVLVVAWNPIAPMEFATQCDGHSVQVWQVSSDSESVVVRMLWGLNLKIPCAEGLVHSGATGLSAIQRKLLVQRGAVDSFGFLEGERSDA